MADFQTSKVDVKLAPANVGQLNFVSDRSLEDEPLLMRLLIRQTKNTNMVGS
jgi:hypothetical protein